MNVVRKNRPKLRRVRHIWERANGPRQHRRNGVTAAAEYPSVTKNISCMTAIATRVFVVRVISDIRKRLLAVFTSGHPIFCWERVARVAVLKFIFFMGSRVV